MWRRLLEKWYHMHLLQWRHPTPSGSLLHRLPGWSCQYAPAGSLHGGTMRRRSLASRHHLQSMHWDCAAATCHQLHGLRDQLLRHRRRRLRTNPECQRLLTGLASGLYRRRYAPWSPHLFVDNDVQRSLQCALGLRWFLLPYGNDPVPAQVDEPVQDVIQRLDLLQEAVRLLRPSPVAPAITLPSVQQDEGHCISQRACIETLFVGIAR